MNPRTDIIAERIYEVEGQGDPKPQIKVLLTKPYRKAQSPFVYGCDMVYVWMDGTEHVQQGQGADSLQALKCALQLWSLQMEYSQRKLQGKIRYLGENDLDLKLDPK